MREILFRGKRVPNGEWVEGYITEHTMIPHDMQSYMGFVIECKSKELYECEWYEVIPETVGQYTGLKDKNGKKIFEGDIVNCYTFTGMNDYRRGVVHWNEMFCGWYGKESCSLLCGLGEIYEIIGNIHDNPELLKEA